MRTRQVLSRGVLLLLTTAACSQPTSGPMFTNHPSEPIGSAAVTGAVLDLPAPRTMGGPALDEILAERRSVREFTDEPLALEDLSQLLWAAQGITADWGGRTAPSAGALYPLEVYVATPEGLYHYLPDGHRAQVVQDADVRSRLGAAAFGQEAVSGAAVVFAITAVYVRTAAKYGARAERYVQLEAGHACQNLLLEAVALGLGAVPIGAFDDGTVARILGLPAGESPLYLVPVGHPGA
jgi:SagB-type dehydrogenase family enzyme